MNVLHVGLVILSLILGCTVPALSAPPDTSPQAPSPPFATESAGAEIDTTTPRCSVGIVAIIPHDATTIDGHEYAAILYSTHGEGEASGTLWVNGSDNAYHVAFTQRKLLSQTNEGTIDAIDFTLPVDTHLDNAFVDHIDSGAQPLRAGCRLLNPWFPRANDYLPHDLIGRFQTAIPHAVDSIPIVAQTITNLKTACPSPLVPPATLIAVAPRTPSRPRKRMTVEVLLGLAADSSILSAAAPPETIPAFASASIDATRKSLFRTIMQGCRPISASYIFRVEYRTAPWYRL